jgi:phage shock protein C
MESMNMAKKLYRSQGKKMIGGVCGGISEYFDVDANLIRIIFVAISLFTAVLPMVVFYLVVWAVIPLPEKGK